MEATMEAMEIKNMTTEEAAKALTVGDALKGIRIVAEILKSPCTLRPKKDKQAMVPIFVSPWNLMCTNLLMEEKGKVITIETNEEEEYLEELIIEEDEEKCMEEENEPRHPPTKLLAYVPSWKGNAKVTKDLDETKISLYTPLLPDNIIF